MEAANGIWTPNTATLPYRGTSAEDSTVGDLFRFATALTGKSCERALHGPAHDRQGGRGRARKYAYGFGDTMKEECAALATAGARRG